ncbi:MAG: amidase [Phycisphaerae bacterium]|nr:amidase [Phycisphaerae bacterium]
MGNALDRQPGEEPVLQPSATGASRATPGPGSTPAAPVSRRTLLWASALAAVGAHARGTPARGAQPDPAPAREPPPLDAATLAAAERVAGVSYTPAERDLLLKSLPAAMRTLESRRRFALPENAEPPALRFDPRPPGMTSDAGDGVVRTSLDAGGAAPPRPSRDEDIAFASVLEQASWIRSGAISSRRLTEICLDRLARFDDRLRCVVTLTDELALRQADRADAEIRAGHWRGPLHGLPWGAKDLFDTAGIRTTWGAEPFVARVPDRDARVVQRLERAGAVLVAKLSLGALAMGDVWFGGRTNNPWDTSKGSSGSSAGCGAAVPSGLVSFGIGTETWGSIVSPSVTCGCVGLRPTFGRVARTGAMALCWSLDKIGPMTRRVEDALVVLHAINGADVEDPSSIEAPLSFDAARPVRGRRLGYHPAWFELEGANRDARVVLDAARRAGLELVEIDFPDGPFQTLEVILLAEAAASFESLTRSGGDDALSAQGSDAWPNIFRQSWFIPACEVVQADRLRRRAMMRMHERLSAVDAIVDPSDGNLFLCGLTNFTGHPSLTIRAGFRPDGTPHGVSLIGRLYDEGGLCGIGMALERELGVAAKRPPGFG